MSAGTNAELTLFADELPCDTLEIAQERARVRAFIAEATESGLVVPACDSWLAGHSPEFSAELGRRGWIGMTWPTRYGGREASTSMRLAVIEELLAAGAPVAAHWFSDRQIGPSLLRYGTEDQRRRFLPDMAAGTLHFCIGMSEPDSGSDLGSVRTRARRVDGGWRLNGSKIWTSFAQHAHWMLALVRTGEPGLRASEALTQVFIDMTGPGLSVRPIRMIDGREHFCEVFFDDVFVPDERVLGEVDAGWRQVLGELGFERSGPERFLSTFPLLTEIADRRRDLALPTEKATAQLLARLLVLRAMVGRINQRLEAGEAPGVAAAVLKDSGTMLEVESLEVARASLEDVSGRDDHYHQALALLRQAQSHSPGFTLRGGASEVMRDIVARSWRLT
jgi:acyl-CoA dehydrogenase